ncbi:MAG: extracellular solute-binding protein [Defluviitaleaceae bacterium]|nr:extracellular solute-binding protein [Defluviitaleaceae bacterium]
MKNKKIRLRFVILAIIVVIFIALIPVFARGESGLPAVHIGAIGNEYIEASYALHLAARGWEGVFADDEIHIDLTTARSETMPINFYYDAVITENRGYVTFEFNVSTPGFYNLFVEYMPMPGAYANIERRILINDEIQHFGMEQILFMRSFDNTGGGPIEMRGGNEVRPQPIEVFEWAGVYVNDSRRRTPNPYRIYLPAGRNTITVQSLRESMMINSLIFREAHIPLPFAELTRRGPNYQGPPISGQAERMHGATHAVFKSSRSIINQVDFVNPDTYPSHPYRFRFNTIGGDSWRNPAETISWDIYAPHDGYYGITFRARQHTNRGVISFRRLWVNGEVPFAEAQALGFPHSPHFVQYGIYDANGQTMPIWLNAGINHITLENVLGELAGPLSTVEYALSLLNDLYRRIIQITTERPDRFIDYRIEHHVPIYEETLLRVIDLLSETMDIVIAMNDGERSANTSLLEMMIIQARRMVANPGDIARELVNLNNNISSVGEWVINVSEMPLEIDSITLHNPSEPYTPSRASLWQRFTHAVMRLGATFVIDESFLGEGDVPGDAVTVWIPSGRDPAMILQNLLVSDFMPTTDIPVNLQLIPVDVVIPATLSGIGPDVVLNMTIDNVVNFAMRNALVPLNTMPGWDEFSQQFWPAGLETVYYFGNFYGVPETMSFLMMYMRDDILAEVGIEAPRTWDEFKQAIVRLNQFNYDVFVPETSTAWMALFPTLLFQHGGHLFLGEGPTYGIASALYSQAAMEAFHTYTNMYTAFGVPLRVNFVNRFRTGEIPLGIADYTFFNTLEVFAPEIRGLWSFAPLPGLPQPDGTINNKTVAGAFHTVLLANDDPQVEHNGWEFIRWWLSTETQVSFGLQLEAVLGTAGRYATSQRAVLERLPWAPDVADVLVEQFENVVGMRGVPGSYMVPRMVDYAFRAVVTNDSALSPRQALHMNIFEIDRELTRRRLEFDMVTVHDHPEYLPDFMQHQFTGRR